MSNGTKVGLLGAAVLVVVIAVYYAWGPAQPEPDEPTPPAPSTGTVVAGLPTTQLDLDALGDPIDDDAYTLESASAEPDGDATDATDATDTDIEAPAPQPAATQPAATQPATTQPSSTTQPAATTQPTTPAPPVVAVDPPTGDPPTPRRPDPPVIGVEHEPDRLVMGDPAEKLETYTVQDGDSMWVIARKTLGAGSKWELIAKANPHINPDRIKAGDKLVIPRLAADPGPVSEKTPTDPLGLGFDDKAKTVTVGDGENLWKIAEREYGDGLLWKHIYTANRDKLKNPDAVRAGMKLVVPPLPRE